MKVINRVTTAVSFLLAGCFRYVPVQPVGISPPAEVRIALAPPRPVELRRDTGAVQVVNVVKVQGSMTARRGDTLVLRNARLTYSGLELDARVNPGESPFIPAAGDSFHVRQLDRGRTALVVIVPIGVVALLVVLAQSVLSDVATAGTGQ
jgi:hypothetical protein